VLSEMKRILTRCPSVARITHRIVWQYAILLRGGIGAPILGEQMSGSATVRLDRALVSFYRLLIVTVPLTEAGGLATIRNASILGCIQYPHLGELGVVGVS